MTKAKRGDLRPVYQQVGWEVCKKEAEKPEGEEWIASDQQATAELLSISYKKKED